MVIVQPSALIISITPDPLHLIEKAGRVCYKSEANTNEDTATAFASQIIARGHESVLEHASATVRFICDRGVSHELVRHRFASFSQESTRYCNYSHTKFGKEIAVIEPCFWDRRHFLWKCWFEACLHAESSYFDLLDGGATAQEARSVLPNSLKTEVFITANMREWRHIFYLRCAEAAHPQMRQLMRPLLRSFHGQFPALFDDLFRSNDLEDSNE